MDKCSPACFASQPREAPLASAHLRDLPVEGKINRTCGSWEKHSKNSEEGLPLAVVWQCVVEHQLFRVADEAVLCGDMEGERRTLGTSRAAGDPPAALSHHPSLNTCTCRGCFQGPSERMNINLFGGGEGRNQGCHSCPILLRSHTKFYFPNKFYRRQGRGESNGWDTSVMHLVYWVCSGGSYSLTTHLKDGSNSSINLNLLGRVKPDSWCARH